VLDVEVNIVAEVLLQIGRVRLTDLLRSFAGLGLDYHN
jgi:hypothetical protein